MDKALKHLRPKREGYWRPFPQLTTPSPLTMPLQGCGFMYISPSHLPCGRQCSMVQSPPPQRGRTVSPLCPAHPGGHGTPPDCLCHGAGPLGPAWPGPAPSQWGQGYGSLTLLWDPWLGAETVYTCVRVCVCVQGLDVLVAGVGGTGRGRGCGSGSENQPEGVK